MIGQEQGGGDPHVWFCEAHFREACGQHGDGRHGQIEVATLELLPEAVKFERHELELAAQVLRQEMSHIDVVTDELIPGIEEAGRQVVRVITDADGPGIGNPVECRHRRSGIFPCWWDRAMD